VDGSLLGSPAMMYGLATVTAASVSVVTRHFSPLFVRQRVDCHGRLHHIRCARKEWARLLNPSLCSSFLPGPLLLVDHSLQ
jgi:hypothetical protein